MSEREERAHGADQGRDRDAPRHQRPQRDRDQHPAPNPGHDLAKPRDPHPEHDPDHARAADDGSGQPEGQGQGQRHDQGQSLGQSQDPPREHRPDDQPAPGIGTTTPAAGTPGPGTPGATTPGPGAPRIDTSGAPATGAGWGAPHFQGAGAASTVPPARAADPEHAAVPDGGRPLPVPEQAGTHRAPRAPSEPPPRGPRAVLVEGNRFRLRELHPTDVDAVLAVFGDPGTSHAFGTRPLQRFDAVALVEHAVATSRHRPRTHYRLGVSRVDTDELIGTAKLVLDRSTPDPLVRTGHRSAEVGVAFRADQASVGHGMDVGYLLGLLGFGRLGLHRMWAGFLPTNTAGQRIAATVGMTREGLLRHHGYANGTWHDIVQYAILEHDWHARLGRQPHPYI